MNLPDGLLDGTWTIVAWVLFVPLAILALRRAPWRVLGDSGRLNFWLGLIVSLILLWNMKAGVKPGLSLHLLGAGVMALCFGWALAFVGLCLVLAGATLNGVAGWEAFAANALLMAGVGVAVSRLIHRAAERFLPRHLFVYVFINGFFGSALAAVAVGLGASLLLALAGVYDVEYLTGEYLPYFLLLGFSEGWLSGMVMTLLVVYRPDWVSTFEDARYLKNK